MGRILTALGDEALIRREIIARIKQADPGLLVYDNDLGALLSEMLSHGELERVKEPRGPRCTITAKGGYRWRWRRRTPELSSELCDLERRLRED